VPLPPKGLLGPVAAGIGGLFASDDAEAAPVRPVVHALGELVNLFNKRTAAGEGKKNALSVPQSLIHDPKFSTYDALGKYAKGADVDGTTAGPYWKEGVQSIYDQIVEHGGLSNESLRQLEEWRKVHLGRPLGYVEEVKTTRAPVKPPEPNNAFGGLKEMMAASAAGAAGSTKAGEMTSPETRGFQPWSDFEPEPSYWDRVTDPSTYKDAVMPWLDFFGNNYSSADDSYNKVGSYTNGIGRGIYGLATGESFGDAWDNGVRVSGNSPEHNAELAEQWAAGRGWHKDDSAALGFATEYLANPLAIMGMGVWKDGISTPAKAAAESVRGLLK